MKKVAADSGQLHALFWAAVIAIILIGGSILGAVGTKYIDKPALARIVQQSQRTQDVVAVQYDVDKLELKIKQLEKRISSLEGESK